MFGGKKLKDLTEEDIRKYAASLAGPATTASGDLPPASDLPPAPPKPARSEASAAHRGGAEADPAESRRLAGMIAENNGVRTADPDYHVDEESSAAALEGANKEREEEERWDKDRQEFEAAQEARRKRQQELVARKEVRISEEERMRLEVLKELDQNQMPAVETADGQLQKSIEHFTFADSAEIATISIDLEKDLFEGCAPHVTEANVDVQCRDTSVTILLRGIPASGQTELRADWRLHLSPLYHTVEPGSVSWKLRKGKVSVKLKKRKVQEWRNVNECIKSSSFLQQD